jgi:hypothetical protein
MAKIIKWTVTEGPEIGYEATTVPAPQEEVAQLRPEVADMTEDEYIQFIIDKDVMPKNPSNVHIVDL